MRPIIWTVLLVLVACGGTHHGAWHGSDLLRHGARHASLGAHGDDELNAVMTVVCRRGSAILATWTGPAR